MTLKAQMTVLAVLTSVSIAALAQDPSIHEVYQAADHGQLAQAQQMMQQVLKDHPASAKAHYVDAELWARQGQLDRARAELGQAERLQPGLPFARASAVSELRARLAPPAQSRWAGASAYPQAMPGHPPGLPWGMILGALALAGLGYAWYRSRQAQATTYNSQPVMLNNRPFGGYGGYSGAPYPSGPVPGGGGGGGLGSQMLGGLATGAAVGAGMVAGEALMHRMFGGASNSAQGSTTVLPIDNEPRAYEALPDPSDDMGGQDFGLNDSSSWDDGGLGGGDDGGWN